MAEGMKACMTLAKPMDMDSDHSMKMEGANSEMNRMSK